MTWVEITEAIVGIAEAGAVIAAAVAARQGLNTWRREFVGKRRAEQAEEVLAMFYEACSKLLSARRGELGRFDEGGAGPRVKPEEFAPEEDADRRRGFYTPADILDKQAEFWARLLAARYKFSAVLGRNTEDHFLRLEGLRRKIISVADTLLMAKKAPTVLRRIRK